MQLRELSAPLCLSFSPAASADTRDLARGGLLVPEGRSMPWAKRRGGGASTAVRRKQRSCRGTSRMLVSGDGLPLTGDVMPRKPEHYDRERP